MTEALFQAIVQQRELRPSFVSLLAFKVQQLAWQREPPGSYDYAYWHDRGWLASERTFYMAHRTSPVKVALARWGGAVLHHFVA